MLQKSIKCTFFLRSGRRYYPDRLQTRLRFDVFLEGSIVFLVSDWLDADSNSVFSGVHLAYDCKPMPSKWTFFGPGSTIHCQNRHTHLCRGLPAGDERRPPGAMADTTTPHGSDSSGSILPRQVEEHIDENRA